MVRISTHHAASGLAVGVALPLRKQGSSLYGSYEMAMRSRLPRDPGAGPCLNGEQFFSKTYFHVCLTRSRPYLCLITHTDTAHARTLSISGARPTSNVEVERTATGRTSRAVALAWSSLTTHAAHTRRQTQSPDATGTSLCPPGASKSTARHTHRRRDTATWLLPGRGTRSRTRRTRLSTPEHCSAPQPCPSAPLPPRAPLPSEGPPPKRQDCRSAP